MLFGEYIRSKGFTAKRLAEEAGISVRTVEAYANNRRPVKKCSADLFLTIAKILDVDPYKLIEILD